MNDYIFTKRHVLDALCRVREVGRALVIDGIISTVESVGYEAAAHRLAIELGVDKEYMDGTAPDGRPN
jgi:hypothetical protein